ncbi:hypothetical protein B0H21DRAFT_740527 [Amylocystis lapponica]|nr:hypothetical protein B0H21DRAFT_740527 [Amylocystis lapponica]
MLHNAARIANLPSASFPSILQVAAGRAWARTRPECAYHRAALSQHTPVVSEGVERDDSRPDTLLTRPSTSRAGAQPTQHDESTHCGAVDGHGFSRATLESHRKHLKQADRYTSEMRYPRCTASDLTKPAKIPRKYRNVRFVNADDLESKDTSFIDRGLDPLPPVETDPPWTEIIESMSVYGVPVVTVRQDAFSAVPMSSVPDPLTPRDLHQNLLHFLHSRPLLSLRGLLAYHAAFPALHSSSTFNLLITLAIRFASFGTAEFLLKRMKAEGVAPNLDTHKLRVRLMVRTGQWDRCWKEEREQAEERGQALPLTIWLEFFGTTKRGAFRTHPRRDEQLSGRATKAEEYPERPVDARGPRITGDFPSTDAIEDARKFRLLMEHGPSLTLQERARVYPRVMHHVLRALIRTDQRTLAMSLTAQYFQALPPQLDSEWRKTCLDIIHLHMAPGWKRNLSEHYVVKRTVLTFLGMHPSFRPTSTTLFLLLRTLRATKRSAELGQALVRNFTRRWGLHLVDDRVGRRLASFALKQGNLRVARALERSQKYFEEARAVWLAEQEVKIEARGGDRERKLRWSDALHFSRRSVEGWRWRLFRRRLWRVRSKLGSRNNANKQ